MLRLSLLLKSDDVYQALPFTRSCLQHKNTWITAFHGLELFKLGQLLRTGDVFIDKDIRHFLNWKGPDIGKFTNIRQEFEEEITPATTKSTIIRSLGGRENISGISEVIQELERLGHHRFMSFEGTNLAGYYKSYNISVKLMSCAALKWPLMVEIEQTANTEEEAVQCEQTLRELCDQLQLHNRLVREEPPSLLYDALFVSNLSPDYK